MNGLIPRALALALACGAASLVWALPQAGAAPRPASPKPNATAVSPDLAFAFAVPAELQVQIEPYPEATRSQTREVVTLLRQGGEVARLDVWLDDPRLDLQTWMRREFDFQLVHGQLRRTVATARKTPAFELAMPGGQVEPQTIRFWRDGPLFCRLTLVGSSQAVARQAFELATTTFARRPR